jgi:ketosteroid isomerase-like protein
MKTSTPEQVSMGFAEAITAGDLDRTAAFFAPDARFLAADGRIVEGRAAIREVLQLLMARRPTMSTQIERMIETPRGAIGSERWSLAFEGDGEKPVTKSSCSTVVFARTAEDWEILIYAPWGLTPEAQAQGVEQLTAVARDALSEPRRWLDEIAEDDSLRRAAGLFAIHASASVWRHLGLGEPPDERPLYVGMASGGATSRGLKSNYERPFAAGRASDVSLRRSFAALLATELGLAAIPRPTLANRGAKQWRHFALEESGDRRLTEWMRANLRITTWVCPSDAPLEEIRAAILQTLLPPLCLLEITTPWTEQVKAARAELAAQAKACLEGPGPDAESEAPES